MITVAIIFGGASSEHRESIRATRILYENIGELFKKYKFKFFYVTKKNEWVNEKYSKLMVKGELPIDSKFTKNFSSEYCESKRMLELKNADVIYCTGMSQFNEKGDVMGLANILKRPMIGCDILASALCVDKRLSKELVERCGIRTAPYIYVDKNISRSELASNVAKKIGYPCFGKPSNLGTCAHIFRADDENELVKKFKEAVRENDRSDKYLIEKYIDGLEVRIFVYMDTHDKFHTNDLYVTKLNERRLDGDDCPLFEHFDNKFSDKMREKLRKYAIQIFQFFGMKDYARIDFFVEKDTERVYFNEANTQPFIGGSNIKYMEKDGLTYAKFFDMMIKRNTQVAKDK